MGNGEWGMEKPLVNPCVFDPLFPFPISNFLFPAASQCRSVYGISAR
jgi:hypothetical protein